MASAARKDGVLLCKGGGATTLQRAHQHEPSEGPGILKRSPLTYSTVLSHLFQRHICLSSVLSSATMQLRIHRSATN